VSQVVKISPLTIMDADITHQVSNLSLGGQYFLLSYNPPDAFLNNGSHETPASILQMPLGSTQIPLTSLAGAEFVKAWLEVVTCMLYAMADIYFLTNMRNIFFPVTR
jgi:hypothetical protein